MRHTPRILAALLVVVGVAVLVRPAQGQITFTDSRFSAQTVATLPTFSAVGVAFAPDGRLFIWQRQGIVRIVKNGLLLPTPFLDIRSQVNQFGDRGLLGLALDPDFAISGRVYLLYTHEAGGNPVDGGPKTARLTRVTADPANPDVALPGSEVVILGNIPSEGPSHTIGTVRVAADGTLVLSVGDAASFSVVDQRALRAQDLSSLNGKILRIRPDGTAPGNNPFDDGTNSIRSKILAYGLRNPFRFALHPVTGVPYIGDVGWNAHEEINRGGGRNFGWPCFEGVGGQPDYQSAFSSRCAQIPSSAVTPPLHTYSHAVGAAVIAGAFYNAAQYPLQYQGNFFIADYVAGWIRRLVFDASGNVSSVQPFATGIKGPVALELGRDGALYCVEFNTGRVIRIRSSGPQAVASATPTSGPSPLTVQFSSAGSQSPAGTPTYAWDFGDGGRSTAPNPSHTYTVATLASFTATLTVTDPNGVRATDTVRIVVGSRPPTPTITTPANGTDLLIGQTIVYQGSATDPEQGPLPATALAWTVLLHHNTHVHPVKTGTGSSGSFVVENHGEGTFSYEVILTATDSTGLQGTTSILLPVNAQGLPYVTSLSFSPSSVVGGSSSTGTVRVSQAAPSGGLTVALSSASTRVQVPASVTIPAGGTSATFTATTSAVTATVVATVTATRNGSVQGLLTVNPSASVAGLMLSPNPVVGGTLATGTVTLSAAASGSGAVVALRSDASAVQVPATVTVPAGSSSASFLATTLPVTATVTATITASLNGSLQSTLTVTGLGSGSAFIFNYASRTALLAAGWDFMARTAAGGARNTEQTGTLGIDYNQSAHPGTIRMPLGGGELWERLNSSQNMLFRNLPADWTSIRLKVAAFNPTGNYQQVGLLAYQDDDTYVNVQRNFNATAGGSVVGFFKEAVGVVTRTDRRPLANTGNLVLRLDRAPTTHVFTAFYSVDNGASWTQLTGAPTQVLTNPRLAIQVGANVTGAAIAADLAYVEIVRAGGTPAAPPPPALSSVSPSSGTPGQALNVTIAGANFGTGVGCSFGAGITVTACTRNSTAQLTAAIAIATGAAAGPRTVTVTNPDGQSASLSGGFAVVTAAVATTTGRIDFTYADRGALLADGWSYVARTAAGGVRNTEGAGGLVVDYSQATHPGRIRLPVGPGEIWQGLNSSANTLFRGLPADWTSIRLKIAAFGPVGNYQQVGLLAYQDDDNYVSLNRGYINGPVVELFGESGGVVAGKAGQAALSNTGTLVLRLDRNPATNVFTAFYSVNDGGSWTAVPGSVTRVLTSPRLAIHVGGNLGGTTPAADLAWVEIVP
jgi:glucose/arabinose dehydrogenase